MIEATLLDACKRALQLHASGTEIHAVLERAIKLAEDHNELVAEAKVIAEQFKLPL